MASARTRRHRLFSLYSGNLSHYTDDARFMGKFVCPICEDVFGPESIAPGSLAIDIAHVYSDACGGKAYTLTCKKCNSRMGRLCDSQISIMHKANRALLVGDEALRGRLRFPGGSVGVEWQARNGGYHLQVVGQQTSPQQEEALKAFMRAGHDPSFKVTFPWVSDGRVNLALLHSAYLALFREFGYEYVLYAQTRWIREALTAEKPPRELLCMRLQVPRKELSDPALFKTGIASVDGRQFLMAILPSPDPAMMCQLVLLPGIGDQGLDEYKNLVARPDGATIRLTFKLISGSDESMLSAREGVWRLHRVWFSMLRQETSLNGA